MKKTLVSIVVVIVAVAFVETMSVLPAPAQQPAAQQPPAQQPAAGQAAPSAQAPQQKKEIKDPAEYNAYVGAIQQSNPQAKASALEAFLQQYPNSVMKTDALELLMATYEQAGDTAKMQATADRVLQADPNNLRALALQTYSHRHEAEQNQNPQQNLAAAAQYGEKGLQALGSAPKPDGMSDADWTKLKDQTSVIFNGAVGLSALQNKDYKGAMEHLRAAVDQNPNNLTDVYPLALAYYSAGNPPKPATPPPPPADANNPPPPDPAVVDANVQGLFFIARAVNLASGQAQIADFGKKWYTKFHGNDQGWTDLVANAKTQTLPPQGFTIAAAPPPPTPAKQAEDLVNSKPIKEMSFAEWQLVLTSGNQAAADKVWSAIKGVPLQIEGTIISATARQLQIAATVDDIDAKKPDITLNMLAPIPVRLMPKAGASIPFEGTPVSYEAKPFMMVMEKGQLLTVKKPTPTRRRRTTRGR
jgi:tetratricopeptide (TPR) repeat protein